MNDIMGEASGAIASSNGGIATVANNNNNNNNSNVNNNGKAAVVAAAVGANCGEKISAAVTKVLQGYDWTLVPVAIK